LPHRRTVPAQIAMAPSACEVVAALFCLAAADLALRTRGLSGARWLTAVFASRQAIVTDHARRRALKICSALERARLFYPRRVYCVQSAAAAALFLRGRRIQCDFVIGVRRVPFMAHAWVEVAGDVVMNYEDGRM